jgi:copper(I)-binding protein
MTLLRTALVLTLLNLPIHAQGKNPDASDVSAAIVPGGVAIYAMLTNPTMYDAYAQSGTSDAGKVELRDEANKPTSNITIPAYGSVELKAGGPLVLVTELKGQPKAGDTITLKLMTDGGVAIAITAIVK